MIENIKKEELTINKVFGEKSKKINISEDFIISDSKPDVLSVVDENANIFMSKVELLDNKVRMNGIVDVNVLYLSDTGENRSINHIFEFSETLDFDGITDEMQILDDVRICSLRSKILNERKINVELDADISVMTSKKEKLEYVDNLENMEGLQMLQNEIEIKNLVGVGKSKASIRENLPIDNIDQVLDIVSTNINVRNIENKPGVNKILSKADVEVDVTYITVDGHVNSSKREYQAMGFIDIDNVCDENIAYSDYILRNIHVDDSGKDEHNINVELDFDILSEVYENRKVNIINDMYSLKDDLEINKKIEKIRNIDYCDEIIEVGESTSIDELENVLKICAKVELKNVTWRDEVSKISGEVEYKILYEKQNVSGIFLKNIRVPFEKSVNKRFSKDVKLEIIENTFLKRECNIEVNSKIKVVSYCNNNWRFEFIDDVSRAETCEKEDCYSLVIYFVKKDDTLWKIAKKFKTTVDEIIKVNNIENPDNIQIGKKLYIPRVV